MINSVIHKTSAVLLIVSLLFALMVSMSVSAWDEVGDAWAADATSPYTVEPEEDYYISSFKVYEDEKLTTSEIYENTFDSEGFLTSYKSSNTQVTLKYDEQGRLIEKKDQDNWITAIQYRDDGSKVIVTNAPDGLKYAYTFDPVYNVDIWGAWEFERDNNGRKTRMVTDDFDDIDEVVYSYEVDDSGKVISRTYTKKSDGKVIGTGTVHYTYSDDGKTQTETSENITKTITFDKNQKIVKAYKITDYGESGKFPETWNYNYDENGNVASIDCPERKIHIEYTYEYYPKAADTKLNGLVQGPDGKWAMYKNGEVDTSATGIYQNENGWWRVENGYVNFDADSIYQNEYGWWKTTDGKVTFQEDSIYQNSNGWWKCNDSKVDFNAQSIYQNQYGWWKTTDGKVTFKEDGLYTNQYGTWKVKDSKVDFNYNGQYQGKTIKNGKVL